jgi:hypothetical protein
LRPAAFRSPTSNIKHRAGNVRQRDVEAMLGVQDRHQKSSGVGVVIVRGHRPEDYGHLQRAFAKRLIREVGADVVVASIANQYLVDNSLEGAGRVGWFFDAELHATDESAILGLHVHPPITGDKALLDGVPAIPSFPAA